ncbi:hypothetical protein BMS3Abin14_01416 [bacterium BMS3Abin14]|nr:hypothetical protein BMS3Abin14_01416 [bacterium BMS3Abin14]
MGARRHRCMGAWVRRSVGERKQGTLGHRDLETRRAYACHGDKADYFTTRSSRFSVTHWSQVTEEGLIPSMSENRKY